MTDTRPAPTPTFDARWQQAGVMLAALVLLQLLAQWSLTGNLFSVWWNSKTFNHCLLIPFISGWLIWQRRHTLLQLTPEWSAAGLGLLGIASLLLLLGNLAGVAVIGHFGLVLSLQALAWTVLGTAACRHLLFPLLYLWFAVPFGEFLVPKLQDVTADMAVAMLRLIDIPVFHDGHFIAVPNGNFLVEEACSGIAYLIAALALGTLFAYLQYRSYYRRAVFILLSIIVPIVANGIRAFGIILIAHLTNNEYAVGVDHLIYGWIFFGVVMFLLFVIGRTFADEGPDAALDVKPATTDCTLKTTLALPSALILIGLAAVLGHRSSVPAAEQFDHQRIAGVWYRSSIDRLGTGYDGAVSQWQLSNGAVQVIAGYFPLDRQHSELVSSNHRLFDKDRWRQLESRSLMLADVPLLSLRLSNGYGETVRVQRLFLFADVWYGESWRAKWHQLQARLQQRPAPALLLLVVRPEAMTDAELQRELQPLLGDLQAALLAAGVPHDG